mgnify:FL=1
MKHRVYYNEIMEEWFGIHRSDFAKSTYLKYHRTYEKYIYPFFRVLKVRKIDNNVLKSYVEFLEKEILKIKKSTGAETARCAAMLVNRCLEYAEEKKAITSAPRLNMKIRSCKKEIYVFSAEEQSRIEKYCISNPGMYSAGILLCLYTGLRIGELCALKWHDIDLDEGTIRVRRTVQRLSDKSGRLTSLTVSEPKTPSSIRTVPMPECIVNVLRKLYTEQSERGYMFSSCADTPAEPRTFQYRYRKCLENAGVRYRSFHTLRHTFATRCISCGIDIKTLSEIMGHSSVRITLEYYCHTSMERKKEQVNRLSFLSCN